MSPKLNSVPRQVTVTLTENVGRFQLIGTFPHYDFRGEPAHRQIALSEELQTSRTTALRLSQELMTVLAMTNPHSIVIFCDQAGQAAQQSESPTK